MNQELEYKIVELCLLNKQLFEFMNNCNSTVDYKKYYELNMAIKKLLSSIDTIFWGLCITSTSMSLTADEAFDICIRSANVHIPFSRTSNILYQVSPTESFSSIVYICSKTALILANEINSKNAKLIQYKLRELYRALVNFVQQAPKFKNQALSIKLFQQD